MTTDELKVKSEDTMLEEYHAKMESLMSSSNIVIDDYLNSVGIPIVRKPNNNLTLLQHLREKIDYYANMLFLRADGRVESHIMGVMQFKGNNGKLYKECYKRALKKFSYAKHRLI